MKAESVTVKNIEAAFAGESMAHIIVHVFRQDLPRTGRR